MHSIMKNKILIFLIGVLFVFGLAKIAFSDPAKKSGIASWYSAKDCGVRKYTASGEIFDDSKRTCASWHFKLGTRVRVTNTQNGKSVVCTVNDRGPAKRYKKKRVIDLTQTAFKEIGSLKRGLVPVALTRLD